MQIRLTSPFEDELDPAVFKTMFLTSLLESDDNAYKNFAHYIYNFDYTSDKFTDLFSENLSIAMQNEEESWIKDFLPSWIELFDSFFLLEITWWKPIDTDIIIPDTVEDLFSK